jgi:hypothetical protein
MINTIILKLIIKMRKPKRKYNIQHKVIHFLLVHYGMDSILVILFRLFIGWSIWEFYKNYLELEKTIRKLTSFGINGKLESFKILLVILYSCILEFFFMLWHGKILKLYFLKLMLFLSIFFMLFILLFAKLQFWVVKIKVMVWVKK